MAFENFPVEVLQMIFGYLGVSDRLSASAVCKKWYYASLDKSIWKDTAVHVGMEKVAEGLNMLMNCDRLFSCVVFQGCDHLCHDVDAIKAIGRQLSVLQFKNCSLSGPEFTRILSECPNLQSLSVVRCDVLFTSEMWLEEPEGIQKLKLTLQNVKELDLSWNKKLNDMFFTRLAKIFTNVKSISFAKCPISFQGGVFTGIKYSNNVLTFACIKEFLENNARRITSVNFDSTNIDDITLKTLAQIEGLQLESISLSPCPLITFTGMKEFCRYQKKLKKLDFYGPVILHQVLPEICDNLLELRELYVRSYFPPGKISTFVALKMQSLRKLVKLNLDSYSDVLVLKFIDSLRSKAHPRLKHLNLHNDEVDDFDFSYMIPYLLHITYLDLGGTLITDKSLVMISANLTHLQILRLAQCGGITDQGLTGHYETRPVLLNCSGLINSLKAAVKSKNEEFSEWHALNEGQSTAVSNLKGLRELNLYNIAGATDDGLKVALVFKELKCLFLGGSSKLTDKGLSAIGQNNRSLEVLSVRNSKEITENGIAKTLSHLPRLRSLDVRGCRKLRDGTISSLVKSHSSKLKYFL